MEQILREPVELTDGDLHLVAGGTASAAAASGTNQAAAVSAAGAASEVFSSPLAIVGFTGVGTTTAAAIGR
jgi:hypothetical protein